MRVVNVCFHGIGDPGRNLEAGEARYWVGRDAFHEILDLLVDSPRVRLSFDDGNASDAQIALPALRERGLRATFFVIAGRLDRPGSLSRNEVATLAAAGMGVGNHGMSHRPWRSLDREQQREELVSARQSIAAAAGRPVDEAALPLGRYDRRVLSQLRRLGYRRVHTSDRHPARPDSWLQPRYSVHADDTADSVRREILTRPAPSAWVRGELATTIKRWR